MNEKIIPELKFLTKDDILVLCAEAQKPTELGKLAVISLDNIISILNMKANTFYNEASYYGKEHKRWFIFEIIAVIVCLIFLPRIPISHILFWVHLGFLAIGFIGTKYSKILYNYYRDKHVKVGQIILMIHKALHVGEAEKA